MSRERLVPNNPGNISGEITFIRFERIDEGMALGDILKNGARPRVGLYQRGWRGCLQCKARSRRVSLGQKILS